MLDEMREKILDLLTEVDLIILITGSRAENLVIR